LVGDVLGDPLVLWVAAIVLLTTVSTVLHRRRAGADHVAHQRHEHCRDRRLGGQI